jgi:choice-of-anchor C domain-containing protein
MTLAVAAGLFGLMIIIGLACGGSETGSETEPIKAVGDIGRPGSTDSGAGASAAADSPLRNPGFESGRSPEATFAHLRSGSTALYDWDVQGVDYVGGSWAASEGGRSIDLNGFQPGLITQVFPTEPGQEYALTFDMAGNPFGPPAAKVLEVSAGATAQEFTFDTTGKTGELMGWEAKAFTFDAEGTETTLTFTSRTEGQHGPAIDNLRLTP